MRTVNFWIKNLEKLYLTNKQTNKYSTALMPFWPNSCQIYLSWKYSNFLYYNMNQL